MSKIEANETRAEYALRILTESLAYFTPMPTIVRDGAARSRADGPDLPQAA